MSTFKVPVVRIREIHKHPNADTLSITQVDGCPVIFRTGDFEEGDFAVYVPVEAVVPLEVPGTAFLNNHRRIKAKRLRGIFSMGLLLPIQVLWAINPMVTRVEFNEGDDAGPALGIKKYEEPEPLHMQTEMAPAPQTNTPPPEYDVESYRKYKHVFKTGEYVVITEKIHGTNSRFLSLDGELHVGSRTTWKKKDESNLWWKVAARYDLEKKLADYPGFVFYGETYGQVQDLKYGAGVNEHRLAIFDIFDSNKGQWLGWSEVVSVCTFLSLPTVPVLWEGHFGVVDIDKLCDGDSVVSTTKQIREGFVIKPVFERWDPELGRVIAKLVGEEYLTRKGGTEFH